MTLRRAVLLFVAGVCVFAQRKDPAVFTAPQRESRISIPAPSRMHRLPRPASIGLGRLSAEERAKIGVVGEMRRTGLHRPLPEEALGRGSWTTLPDGQAIWRVAIQSDQAAGMRVE